MPKTVPKTKKSKSHVVAQKTTRQIKNPAYKTLRISKRIKSPKPALTGSFRLFARTVKLLIKNWRLFGGILLVYVVLTLVMVKTFGVTNNLNHLKTSTLHQFHGSTAELATDFTLFGVLLGGNNSDTTGSPQVYQTILSVIFSLVLIWALRQTLAGKKSSKVSVRDAFYNGMYPLVPFVLVLLVILLQLIPAAYGSYLYGVLFTNGLAVTVLEKWIWSLLIGSLILLTLYMITSSIFALYIVTLPNIRPMQALRTARDLVRFRRWIIMRKVLFLPVALVVLLAAIVVPIIFVSPGLAEWVFFVVSLSGLSVLHGYMYQLYRELM